MFYPQAWAVAETRWGVGGWGTSGGRLKTVAVFSHLPLVPAILIYYDLVPSLGGG